MKEAVNENEMDYLETIYKINEQNPDICILLGFNGDDKPVYIYPKKKKDGSCLVFCPYLRDPFEIVKTSIGPVDYTCRAVKKNEKSSDTELNKSVIMYELSKFHPRDPKKKILFSDEAKRFVIAMANAFKFEGDLTIHKPDCDISVSTYMMADINLHTLAQVSFYIEGNDESVQFVVDKSSQTILYGFKSEYHQAPLTKEQVEDFEQSNLKLYDNYEVLEQEILDLLI